MHGIVQLLYCTFESNITLYVNHTGIKIFLKMEANLSGT